MRKKRRNLIDRITNLNLVSTFTFFNIPGNINNFEYYENKVSKEKTSNKNQNPVIENLECNEKINQGKNEFERHRGHYHRTHVCIIFTDASK